MSNWKRFTNSMAKLHFASDGTGSIPQLKEMIINLQNVALPFKDEQIINLQVKHGRVQHWIFHSFTYSFKRNMSSAFKDANVTKVTESNSKCRKNLFACIHQNHFFFIATEKKKGFQVYPIHNCDPSHSAYTSPPVCLSQMLCPPQKQRMLCYC